MQRSSFFTASEREIGAGAPGALARSVWLPAVTALLVVAVGAQLAADPNTPVWDQARLLQARFEAPWHPAPPFGFTAQLLVALLRPLAGDAAGLDAVVRTAALALWAGGAIWLAGALLERRSLQAALLLALFSSQYPFLWLSTELIAGGLLFLALGACLRGAPAWLCGVLLALFALGKPDLVLVAVTLLLVFCWQRRAQAPALCAAFATGVALPLLPGLVAFGPDYLTAYGADGSGRGYASFAQHFAALIAPLQLAPGPNPWAQPEPYVERVFSGADSFGDVVTAPGLAYLDFVALSLAQGVRKLGWLFQWAWVAVPVLVFLRRRAGLGLDDRERALLWSFVGVAPFVLLAYPHVRYFARYYPLFWLLVLLSVEKLLARAGAGQGRVGLLAVAAVLLLALAENVQRASVGLALADRLDPYWFPD